ncbi:hypothetical protein [Sphingomonas phyllosphaerae]|uniref:hypothetical protein n=1 Tax=Sphingomonas phyllosphaerae TaxID=257003 RepID=UPI002FF5681A
MGRLERVIGAGTGLLALALSGCVNPSARIASSLEGYGFAPDHSQCVGDRLEKNLSIGQLQQLGRAARATREGDTTPGRLTIGDFIRVAGQVKDPKVPLEVTKAAAGCGIVTSAPAVL